MGVRRAFPTHQRQRHIHCDKTIMNRHARLIAAAPELLTALEGIERLCPVDPDVAPGWNKAWDAMLAALAKVRV